MTARILARAGGTAAGDAAAGWGGDRSAARPTATSARSSRAGRGTRRATRTSSWTRLRAWGDEGLPDSTPAGADAWRDPGRRRRAAPRGDAVTLALAPDLDARARAAARAE